jgi:hypothetical protein
LGFLKDECKSLQKRCAIVVVSEDLSSFDSPGHDALEKAGGLPAIGFAFRRGGRASSLGCRGI